MSFYDTLIEVGFSTEEARRLAENPYFKKRYESKTAKEMNEWINPIVRAYNWTKSQVLHAVSTFATFAGLARRAAENPSPRQSHETKTSEKMNERINFIVATYNWTRKQALHVVSIFPSFAGLDHGEMLKGIRDTYKCTAEQASHSVLICPRFVTLDHQRVLKDVTDVYNCTKKQASRVVLTNPSFAGLDHRRVIRQLSRIGRRIGFDEERVKKEILSNPVLGGYSVRRYFAVIDVFRELRAELGINGMIGNETMYRIWISKTGRSPYVPPTKSKLSITRARMRNLYNGEQPPLMGILRTGITKEKERREKLRSGN